MRQSRYCFLGLLVVLICQTRGNAAVAFGPTCFVMAEVIEREVERRTLASGKVSVQAYLHFRVDEIRSGKQCNVTKGEVYRVTDNYPGALLKGDVIVAGIELISAMGPEGVENVLIWSPLTDPEGKPILDKEKKFEIHQLQSPGRPIP